MATAKPVRLIAWDKNAPALNVGPLEERDGAVVGHFRLPLVYYVGSDRQCGCGFRNASNQNGRWPEEEWRSEDDMSHLEAQPNHEQLVAFLREELQGDESVEFYGTWEGNVAGPALSDLEVEMERLLELDFYFRDRGRYVVKKKKL